MQTITTVELKERLNANDPIVLIDVREPDERAAYNIGGIHIPLGKILALQTEEIEDHKADEIVCYCRSGQRSMQAALMLETMGYQNVKNLVGGMIDWQEKHGSAQ